MWTDKRNLWRFLLCLFFTLGALAVTARGDNEVPSESQCRPYIEKALKELETGETHSESVEELQSLESNKEDSESQEGDTQEATDAVQSGEAQDESKEEDQPSLEVADEPYVGQETADSVEAEVADDNSKEGDTESAEAGDETADDSKEADEKEGESKEDDDSKESVDSKEDGDSKEGGDSKEDGDSKEGGDSKESVDSKEGEDSKDGDDSQDGDDSKEAEVSKEDDDSKEHDSKEESETAGSQEETAQDDDSEASAEDLTAAQASAEEADETKEDKSKESKAEDGADESSKEDKVSKEEQDEQTESEEKTGDNETNKQSEEESGESKEDETAEKDSAEDDGEKTDSSEQQGDSAEAGGAATDGETEEAQSEEKESDKDETETVEEKSAEEGSVEEETAQADEAVAADASDSKEETADGSSQESQDTETKEDTKESTEAAEEGSETAEESTEQTEDEVAADGGDEESDEKPVDELLNVEDVPTNLRPREHITQILRLDGESSESELIIERSADIILRDLKRVYENSIKPLEVLYKYRDLSNRHFGDPEIFSKPLVLFMGPWSGGKSSMVNYLTGIEFTEWSLRTGAEPSPAYFNILMHGKEPEVLDGTQLAADWTFSGLQKFGQGLEERLRGLKYPSPVLEKVNIVEIPGILEVRKQVSRVFPFNDACQWFIDRADIIFLVYDPSKLDVGPETEAILDQLKGRESQTRILLNKADHVKPEELMRVQSALIWNISPLMSSAQPPVMYTVSLWSMPFESSAPVRLLLGQEKELLKDLRHAIDKRTENKIASARRFAVRVRNHAKMVDCYLTTYYNHKTIFGNKKLIAEAIIENPQNYHIYEGLSTLTNISRYDLPDPETYRDFFRLNPLYEFQQLSATCTYFRGCPINRLDIAIAYDLPELVGKYKKMVETATPQGMPKS